MRNRAGRHTSVFEIDLTHAMPQGSFRLPGALSLTNPERLSAGAYWCGRMFVEYRGACQLAGLLPRLGGAHARDAVDRQIVLSGMIASSLEQVRSCGAVVRTIGIPPVARAARERDGSAWRRPSPSMDVLDLLVARPSLRVSVQRAERERATHPALRVLLSEMLATSIPHTRFGWAMFEDLVQVATPSERRRLGAGLAATFRALTAELAPLAVVADGALTPALREIGVFGAAELSETLASCVEGLLPALEDLGLTRARSAWQRAVSP
jgi:hypothetical protein